MSRFTIFLVFALLATQASGQGDDAAGAPGESLRERINRRREEARQRALEEAKEKGLLRAAAQEAYDPEDDSSMWRIESFHVPHQSMMGFAIGGGDVAKFYAEVPRQFLGARLGDGTKIFFYELAGKTLRLAGRGVVSKIRTKARTAVVEADIDAFRYARKELPVRNGLIRTVGTVEVPQLLRGMHPRREHWYMSTQLKGPDTDGWELGDLENFALGQPWKGMTEDALIAMLGPPDQRFSLRGESSVTYGTGEEMRKFTIVGGRVREMTLGGL